MPTPTAPARLGKVSERARVARPSPLFNFTRGVPKGYLISWMRHSDPNIWIRTYAIAAQAAGGIYDHMAAYIPLVR
jgi:hypothetical protein